MTSFYGLSRSALNAIAESAQRGGRVFDAVYRKRAQQFDEIETIPAVIRERLEKSFTLDLPEIHKRFDSNDSTRRYMLRLKDGELVECALIPESGRATFCISTQVGCALGCAFCLTGQLGLIRNLAAGEIVAQALLLDHDNRARGGPERTSVVLMGMGEPLDNYDNTITAIGILQDHCGLSLPLSRITLSTAGLAPAMRRLAAEPLFPNLSISLTGARNETRNGLMPVNRKYPIEEILRVVRELPLARRKRVMFEYVLIDNVTDSIADAEELARLLAGLRVKVNLIPLNAAPELPFRPPADSVALAFQRILVDRGVTTFIRRNRGADVSSACGQLKRKTSDL